MNFVEELEAIKDNTSSPNCNQIPVSYSLFTCFRIQLLVQYSVPYIVRFRCLELYLKGRSSFTSNINTYGIEHIKIKHFYVCQVTKNVDLRKNVLNTSFNHKCIWRSCFHILFSTSKNKYGEVFLILSTYFGKKPMGLPPQKRGPLSPPLMGSWVLFSWVALLLNVNNRLFPTCPAKQYFMWSKP